MHNGEPVLCLLHFGEQTTLPSWYKNSLLSTWMRMWLGNILLTQINRTWPQDCHVDSKTIARILFSSSPPSVIHTLRDYIDDHGNSPTSSSASTVNGRTPVMMPFDFIRTTCVDISTAITKVEASAVSFHTAKPMKKLISSCAKEHGRIGIYIYNMWESAAAVPVPFQNPQDINPSKLHASDFALNKWIKKPGGPKDIVWTPIIKETKTYIIHYMCGTTLTDVSTQDTEDVQHIDNILILKKQDDTIISITNNDVEHARRNIWQLL